MSHYGNCPSCSTLRRLLLAWDGQWFLKTAEQIGFDAAVELNARVRRSFARIEIREWMRDLGAQPRVLALAEAFELLARYLCLGEPGEMQAELVAHGATGAITVHYCPAYAAVRQAGHPRQDAACVACAGTWEAWLGRLLCHEEETVTVRIATRLSQGAPTCALTARLAESGTPAPAAAAEATGTCNNSAL